MTPNDSDIQPYPGLRAYEANENHLFFGREEQSDELLRRLRLSRFLAVVGTSGSGKSSLVRAGLLPSLYGGFMAKAGSVWRIAIMRPGADPIGNLAAALYTPEVFGSNASGEGAGAASLFVETTLRRGPLGLVEATRHGRMAPDENLLILVDQFEEIFRFARASAGDHKDDSAGLVKLLLEAARQQEIPIYVILTMRSDFLGDCARFRGLPEAINDGQYLVPRLTRDQLREAIVGPASVGGAQVAHRLVQRLLGEVGDDPDQLPILQHALMRTWDIWTEHSRKGPLDVSNYEATGGMASALSRHADEAYQELGDNRRLEIARMLFQRLSEKSEDHREIRRPTRLEELCAVVNAGADEVEGVIEVFRRPGRSFLMPPADVPLTARSAIDISHESLMRVWTRLRNWVDEEAESAAQYRRLAQSAALEAKGEAGPMTDPELSITLGWRNQWRPNAAWAERYYPGFAVADAFLEKSRELRDAAVRAGEERRRRELMRARGFAAILGLAFLIVAGFLIYALKQRSEALSQKAEAVSQKATAEAATAVAVKATDDAKTARDVATLAQGYAEEETDKAEKSAHQARSEREVALARESADQSRSSQEDEFDLALLLSAKALDLVGGKEFTGSSSPGLNGDVDATSFFQEHAMQEAKEALLQVLQSHPQVKTYLHGHTAKVNSVAYSRDGKLLASGSDDGSVILWSLPSHKQIVQLKGHLNRVTSVAFSADGKLLASGSGDRTVNLWDVASRRQIGGPLIGHGESVNSVAFAADGRMLATGSNGKVILWDVTSGKPIGTPLPGAIGEVQLIGFSPDGRMLALSAPRRTLIWDVRVTPPQLLGQAIPNSSGQFAFSPDSKTIALPAAEGIALFDLATQRLLRTIGTPKTQIQSLAFSPDGGSVAAGLFGHSVAVYNLGAAAEEKRLVGHRGSVESIAFSPAGDELASGSSDGDLILWDPGVLSRIGRPLIGSGDAGGWAFSPDGKLLVTGNSDGTVRFWNIATAKPVGEPVVCHSKGITSVAFSPDGTTLASGSDDQTIVLLDVRNRRRLGQLTGHGGPVSFVGFSGDGKSLMSSSFDSGNDRPPRNTIFVWDVASRRRRGDGISLAPEVTPVFAPDGRQFAFVTGEKVVVRAVTANGGISPPMVLEKKQYRVDSQVMFSRGGKVLAAHTQFVPQVLSEYSLSEAAPILLWDMDTHKELGALRDDVFTGVMSFSPNAKLLAAAGGQGISLWDVETLKQVGSLMKGDAAALAFSQDGRTLVAIQGHGVTLWDVATTEPLGQIPAKGASSVSFSPVGNTLLVSPTQPQPLTLWDLDIGRWKEWACATSNRNLTSVEWEHQFGKKMQYSEVCPNAPQSPAVATIDAQTQAAIHEGESLELSGQVMEAAAAFRRVLKFRPAAAIDATKWNSLCWVASLNRLAPRVMDACEYAVALSPNDIGNLDTRGVARAMAGNYQAAIQDFQAFVDRWEGDFSHDTELIKGQRRKWITELKGGRNPFTDKVLMELRQQ